MYKEELGQQEQKISQLKQQGADEYDIKKQYEVLQECKMMVPDSHHRLSVAHGDLQQFLEAEEEMKELEEYKDAKSLLDSVELEH